MTDDASVGRGDRRGRTVPVGALVLAIMVAAALGILAIVALAVDSDGGGTGDGSGQDDARLAAGRFAERFLTFEDGTLDEWREDVRALSTAGFAEEVDEVRDGLERLITEAELDASAEVTEIFVGEVDRGAVEVVVVYDRHLMSGAGARDETDRYMQLAMLRVDGEWLVDNVIDIATAGAAGTNPAAPAAPGTTATTGPTGTSPSSTEATVPPAAG